MDVKTPQDLAAVARGRRLADGLSQAKVAEAAGVSRAWLADFEGGKPTVELGRVLAVLSALDLTVDVHGQDTAAEEPGELDLGALMTEYSRGPDERE